MAYFILRATLLLCVCLVLAGCGTHSATRLSGTRVEDSQPAERYCILYCLRQAGYAGQGRIHVLKIDDRYIGELTPNNYYRIELWPGSYLFSVHLPEVTLLGQTSQALSTSKHIVLTPGDAGHEFVFKYEDGMATSASTLLPLTTEIQFDNGRKMAGIIGLRETAKVLELYGARYDGPSLHNKAHGLGTLSWPDGSVYQGVFEYGEATTQGRFFFPQGQYFRGRFREGRPYRTGLLFTPSGQIIFAGRFIDEKPHGRGIRLGNDGPEFCVYDHGMDITKPIEQMAKEALDKQEAAQVEALLSSVTSAKNQLFENETNLTHQQIDRPQAIERGEALDHDLKALDSPDSVLEEHHDTRHQEVLRQQQTLIADFAKTRYGRELVMRDQITAQLNQDMAREQDWCQSEIVLDRRWCQCAPFTDDYLNWKDCVPQ